jgi:hypothetical protein
MCRNGINKKINISFYFSFHLWALPHGVRWPIDDASQITLLQKLLLANCLIALSLLTLITRLKIITVAKQGAHVSYQTSNQMRLFMRDWVFAAVFQHTTNYRCHCNVWDAESVFTQHFLIMPKWRSIILYCTFCGCPFVRIICYSRELRTKKK